MSGFWQILRGFCKCWCGFSNFRSPKNKTVAPKKYVLVVTGTSTQRIHQIEGTKMSYKGKNRPLALAAPQHFRKMFLMILRDRIHPLGGKYVANEPLTPSEHRERPFFRLRTVFSWSIPNPTGNPKSIKNHQIFVFFDWKYVFSYLLEFLKPIEKLNMLGYLPID